MNTSFNPLLYSTIVLLMMSCSTRPSRSDGVEASSDSATISPFLPVPDIQSGDITEKVWVSGNKRHFVQDSCSFYFECDCCYSDMIINADSTYYAHDYCVQNESISYGRFSISADTLTLHSSGHCTTSIYNEERIEGDTITPEYTYTDTVFPASTNRFLATKCGNQLVFQQIDGTEFIALTASDYANAIKDLKQDSIFKRVERLKRPIGMSAR
jgi:hypothetical protein